jgi:Alpha/beta hydrolase family
VLETTSVLIHSPLVGPGTWEPVAEELRRHRRKTVVASLTGVADAPAPQWRHCVAAVRAAAEDIGGRFVLVGHSGAGPLMPAMADAIRGEVAASIFVDAMLPPASGHARLLPAELLSQLRALASDGVLPPWSAWFGESAMRELVPEDDLRAALEREMPRLPLAYFEAQVPVPAGWRQRPCAYLLLSRDSYGQPAAEARSCGWPTAELAGAHHLSLVTDPSRVAEQLLALEQQLAATTAPA